MLTALSKENTQRKLILTFQSGVSISFVLSRVIIESIDQSKVALLLLLYYNKTFKLLSTCKQAETLFTW